MSNSKLIFIWTVLALTVLGVVSGKAEPPPSVREIRFNPENPMTGQPVRLYIKLEGSAIRAEVAWLVNDEEVEKSDYDGISQYVEFPKKSYSGGYANSQGSTFRRHWSIRENLD